MEKNITFVKAEAFAVRIIKFCNELKHEKKEYNITDQLFRSGTSIGANIAESLYAASKADFVNKLQIALKEASEVKYWVRLLYKSEYITVSDYEKLMAEVNEIIRLLTASVNTAKKT